MTRLRARVLAAAAATGLLSMAVTMGISPQTYLSRSWLVPASTVLGLVALGAWARIRGARMGELEYALFLGLSQLFAAITTDLNQPGQVARVSLCLLAPVLVGAVFAERTGLLLAQLAVAVSALLLVARHAPESSNPGMDVCVGAFSLVVVAGVVRLLRELAVRALRTAKAGEITDPLTGLINRRGLERLAPPRWRAQARKRLPVAVLVIDVDHFKRVNDAQGHLVGDDILRRLAELLTAVIRADDLAVRLGGEEFLVLCPATPESGRAIAERIRSAVEQRLRGVTVSIGVDETVPAPHDPLPEAIWSGIDRADQALFLAKQSGRNRVMAAREHPAANRTS